MSKNQDLIGSFLGEPMNSDKFKNDSFRSKPRNNSRNTRSNSDRSERGSNKPFHKPFKKFEKRKGDSNRSDSNDNHSNARNQHNRGFSRPSENRRGDDGRSSRRSNLRNVSKIPEDRFVNRIDIKKNEENKYVSNLRVGDLPVNETIKNNLTAKGISDLTEIQDKAIPPILVGQDVVGVADTGTGKTFAFLVPMVDKVAKNNSQKVLIITPTRELAVQINNELRSLTKGLNQFSVLCIGGVRSSFQEYNLRKRFNFVIGTPGRIKDLQERGHLKLGQFNNLVLDEVDRMMDMGFIDDIKAIISKLPDDRQTLFFTATMNQEIEKLMSKFLSIDHLKVYVKKQDTSANVDQDIIRIHAGDNKMDKLVELIESENIQKAIIFSNTKRNVDHLSKYLYEKGLNNVAIHGDKIQSRRNKAIEMFKTGKVKFLIATDVAARGLDIPKVECVINYDAPIVYDDYIHRIGRTGRANSVGKAYTFVEDSNRLKQKSGNSGNRRGGNNFRRREGSTRRNNNRYRGNFHRRSNSSR